MAKFDSEYIFTPLYGRTQRDTDYEGEDYVGNFNDGEGIRATIQCVNPDADPDADQVVGDMVAVDIRKHWVQ